jgi:hypothetical protein
VFPLCGGGCCGAGEAVQESRQAAGRVGRSRARPKARAAIGLVDRPTTSRPDPTCCAQAPLPALLRGRRGASPAPRRPGGSEWAARQRLPRPRRRPRRRRAARSRCAARRARCRCTPAARARAPLPLAPLWPCAASSAVGSAPACLLGGRAPRPRGRAAAVACGPRRAPPGTPHGRGRDPHARPAPLGLRPPLVPAPDPTPRSSTLTTHSCESCPPTRSAPTGCARCGGVLAGSWRMRTRARRVPHAGAPACGRRIPHMQCPSAPRARSRGGAPPPAARHTHRRRPAVPTRRPPRPPPHLTPAPPPRPRPPRCLAPSTPAWPPPRRRASRGWLPTQRRCGVPGVCGGGRAVSRRCGGGRPAGLWGGGSGGPGPPAAVAAEAGIRQQARPGLQQGVTRGRPSTLSPCNRHLCPVCPSAPPPGRRAAGPGPLRVRAPRVCPHHERRRAAAGRVRRAGIGEDGGCVKRLRGSGSHGRERCPNNCRCPPRPPQTCAPFPPPYAPPSRRRAATPTRSAMVATSLASGRGSSATAAPSRSARCGRQEAAGLPCARRCCGWGACWPR